jgi:hypothetical protein
MQRRLTEVLIRPKLVTLIDAELDTDNAPMVTPKEPHERSRVGPLPGDVSPHRGSGDRVDQPRSAYRMDRRSGCHAAGVGVVIRR